MARRATHKDQYRSTGWCKSLGSAGGARSSGDGNHQFARRANAEKRSAQMHEILQQYRDDAAVRG